MGAGLSSDIKKHVLESWEPRKKAPPALEKEVREFLQHARDLLEVYLAPHAPDAKGPAKGKAPARPSWLEPQQLHIALVGKEPLVEAFLESLREVAPLLEVVAEQGGTEPDEEEDGSEGLRPLDRAAKAGFKCHAFIDEDLHLLRFWALGERALPPDGKLAIPGLPYLDLVVLLVDPGAEQAAVGSKAERPSKPKGGSAAAAAQKEAEQRASLEAQLGELRRRLAALPPPQKSSGAPKKPAAGGEERKAVEAEFKKALSELAGLGGGGGAEQVAQLEAELKAAKARKQALIEDEDYDGAHAAKQREKELSARLEELRRAEERRQGLEDKVRRLQAELQAMGPAQEAEDEEDDDDEEDEDEDDEGGEAEGAGPDGGDDEKQRLVLEQELREVQALKKALIEAEDYDGAHDAKQTEKELLAQLEELKSKSKNKAAGSGDGGRAAVEEELRKVRAQKQALIDAEDYDAAHEAKQREKELLKQLESLPKQGGGGGSDAQRAALEEQLKRARAKKQELIEAEDYEGAHEAKQEEKALLTKLEALPKDAPSGGGAEGGAGARKALEEELEKVRARKRELIEAEDYDAAHEAKQQEKELLAKLENLPKGGADPKEAAEPKKQKAQVEKELQELRQKKQALIEAEDYDGAHEAKQKEKELLATLQSLEEQCARKGKSAGGGKAARAKEREALKQQLEEIQATKEALKEAEDYDGALEAKWRELDLRARLELLKARKPAGGATGGIENELREVQARKLALVKAEDYDGAHEAKQQEARLKKQLKGGASGSEDGAAQEDAHGPERISLQEEIGSLEAKLSELDRKRLEKEQKVEALKEELALVRAEKRELIEEEDFDGAHLAKESEKSLMAQLVELEGGGDDEGSEEGRGAAAGKESDSAEKWAAKVEPLGGSDKPPVLVASCGTASPELRTAMGAKLKTSEVVELQELEQKRCQAGHFWDALRAGLHMVQTRRAFPDCPESDLGGGYGLGDWIFIKDEEHPLTGTFGILTGAEDDGSWDFKMNVRLVDGQVMTLRQDQVNPLATEIKFDVSTLVELKRMDMMWVRLKDLKNKADLNDQEGFASLIAVQKKEEGYDSIYDCPARHTVTLEDGNEVRVKAANFDIYEKERPELQDMPGLVDRLHLDGERYSVLVVRQGERGTVTIKGLAKKPELNGHRGIVVDFDEDTDRFTVRTEVGEHEVSIRRGNLDFDVPRTVAQRFYLRPMSVEEFQGRPDKPARKKQPRREEVNAERDEEVIGAALDRSRRARGEL